MTDGGDDMTDRPVDLAHLAKRVAVLERWNRTMKWVGITVLACLGALLLLGQARPTKKIVEADKFIVRDALGRERVVLGLDHPESPGHSPVRLGLYNEGKSTAILYLSDGFAGLTIATGTAKAQPRQSLQLFANPKEGAGLKVAVGMGKPAVHLRAKPDGTTSLSLKDKTGAAVFEAP